MSEIITFILQLIVLLFLIGILSIGVAIVSDIIKEILTSKNRKDI